ncbi:hypothetical protein PRIPAC_79932 [Pristionchus pacificus]|uniref:G protein-coupled receptor n=1 Tax=Pristionchus pacificus TaxID=54126 RepID=A0A2A6CN25_PRIPA|nr:hypothetical protein PRIPAC_79932 [Pristionchus pacificus]|eukprot:PDM79431.1 G protein-coupled receptor [Pristionchus pacificus]
MSIERVFCNFLENDLSYVTTIFLVPSAGGYLPCSLRGARSAGRRADHTHRHVSGSRSHCNAVLCEEFLTYGIFVLSIFTNSTFIWISATTKSDQIGRYRYLMIYFAVTDILVSITHLVLLPGVQMALDGYIFYAIHLIHKPAYMGVWAGIIFVIFFYQTFTILAFHYIYRYDVVCAPRWSRIFKNHTTFWWSLTAALVQLIYTFAYYEDVQKPSPDPSEPDVWQMDALVTIVGATILFLSTAVIIVICCILILRQLRIVKSFVLSTQMRATQHQLLKALIVQTVIPCVFSYIPIATCFLAPCLGLDLRGIYGDLIIILTAAFPALDPVIMLYFVRSYRNRIKRLWRNATNTEVQNISHASHFTSGTVRSVP